MHKLGVIIASTRPGRVGLPVAEWFVERAELHGKFAIELLDLQAIALPLLDEPNHPRLRKYTKDHTRAWSATVESMDAFAIVTPEYNFACAPALLNAFDYLLHEWAYKPACFVSYGGTSGGLRSVQMTKLVVTSLKMMPLPEAVSIAYVHKLVAEGRFRGEPAHEQACIGMLDELHRWTTALATMRAPTEP